MRLDLAISNQLLAQFPEHLRMLKVLWFGRNLSAHLLKGLAVDGVAESMLVLHILSGVRGFQQVADSTTLGGDGFFADLG